MGKVWPNIVLVRDSGRPQAELRIQCEVELSSEEAAFVEAVVLAESRTAEDLEQARCLVATRVEPAATAAFRRIVDLAFVDQPDDRASVFPSDAELQSAGA